MLNFKFKNPTKIVFGKDTISTIGSEIADFKVKKVLLVYGKGSIFKNGVYDTAVSSLKNNNIDFLELSGIKANPLLSKVKEGINIVKENNIDGILAIGGGSVIDSSKAISAGACYENDVWELFEGNGKLLNALPVFTILTLSATGSEMNFGGVITNELEGKKWAFGSPLLYPKVSIIDPSIQFTLPKIQTVNGAVDIITHVFEAYFDGVKNTDMIDELCEGIIKTVIKHSKILITDPKNYNSRCELAWASTLALNGLTGVGRHGDWASHDIEHSLSVFNDISHGSGLAIIMPAWMKYVYTCDTAKFAKMAKNIFNIQGDNNETLALNGINELQNFYKYLGAPTTLKEVGVKFEDINTIANNASLLSPMGSLKKLEKQDIQKILQIAFE
ncbi:iron-containing alcohol dehydrogenase [Clostridium frigidicarnis]|uniref:Uncharacterized protein n=1 Tax=Clostridium frigidicarnis TaxID=84698 RepID=A0A1I1A008_9CLOT|nr:iron-containing alcohol dehydrogenase [Clostridium frigidicarnis]SFB29723.1 hypothetical protein SAMN04488528_102620 [Clostridium frigidicarnis]